MCVPQYQNVPAAFTIILQFLHSILLIAEFYVVQHNYETHTAISYIFVGYSIHIYHTSFASL